MRADAPFQSHLHKRRYKKSPVSSSLILMQLQSKNTAGCDINKKWKSECEKLPTQTNKPTTKILVSADCTFGTSMKLGLAVEMRPSVFSEQFTSWERISHAASADSVLLSTWAAQTQNKHQSRKIKKTRVKHANSSAISQNLVNIQFN